MNYYYLIYFSVGIESRCKRSKQSDLKALNNGFFNGCQMEEKQVFFLVVIVVLNQFVHGDSLNGEGAIGKEIYVLDLRSFHST